MRNKEMIQWKKASEEKPKGNVLVIYLEPSFGKLSQEMTVAYYDNPEDYEDGNGKGWIQSPSERPLYHVTHWAELPVKHEGLNIDSITQQGIVEDIYNTVDVDKSMKR
jgi:hypothetical protein